MEKSSNVEVLKSKFASGENIFLYRDGAYIGLLGSFLSTDESIEVEFDDELVIGVVAIKISYNNNLLVIMNADEWEL